MTEEQIGVFLGEKEMETEIRRRDIPVCVTLVADGRFMADGD